MARPQSQSKNLVPIITLAAVGLLVVLAVAWTISGGFSRKADTDKKSNPSSSLGKYMIDEDDIKAESAKLEALALEIDGIESVEVMMRSNITVGQQIILDAKSDSSDRNVLESALMSLAKVGWNNQLYRPTDIHVTIVGADGVQLDSRDIGFKLQGIGPKELYDRFGPATAEPDWRP